MMSEGTRRLNQISKKINEIEHPWKSLDPAKADEISRQYERRSQLWKRKIALQCAVLILVQAVSSEGDVLGDAAISSSEKGGAGEDNQENDDNLNTANNSMQNDLEETRQILEQCPQMWKKIKSQGESLRQSIDDIMASQVRELENKPDTDWSCACDTMKVQRDKLQEDIKIVRERVKQIEDRDSKPALKLLHENVDELRKVKEALKSLMKARRDMEALLEEHHGIVASQVESDKADLTSQGIIGEDVEDFLAEEQEAMISYYEAKIDRNARIVDVTSSRKAGSNLIDVTVTPKSDWLEYWRRKKPDHPGLKYVTITYSRDSIFPSNIAIKVDTSNVSEASFDAVMSPLISRTQEWKQKMLESPCLDLHGLIRLFL